MKAELMLVCENTTARLCVCMRVLLNVCYQNTFSFRAAFPFYLHCFKSFTAGSDEQILGLKFEFSPAAGGELSHSQNQAGSVHPNNKKNMFFCTHIVVSSNANCFCSSYEVSVFEIYSSAPAKWKQMEFHL